jgi:hypothetical protein
VVAGEGRAILAGMAFVTLLTLLTLLAAAAPAPPKLRLAGGVHPTRMVLDLTIVPGQPRFSGKVDTRNHRQVAAFLRKF